MKSVVIVILAATAIVLGLRVFSLQSELLKAREYSLLAGKRGDELQKELVRISSAYVEKERFLDEVEQSIRDLENKVELESLERYIPKKAWDEIKPIIDRLRVFQKTGVDAIPLSQQQTEQIGNLLFENECASKNENLIVWNEGEDFLSLGIGHFIWHPANGKVAFEESFIKFLAYAKNSGEKIPAWLDVSPLPVCPWNSCADFLNSQNDARLAVLREFLIKTKPLQAAFIVKRLDESLPLILESAPKGIHDKIVSQFSRIASTPPGVYALADYVNFKGLGISPAEKYQGKGWGLLQVLEEMRDEGEAPDAVKEFSRSANTLLEERVKNSPPGRNEQKWLPGWQKRVNSYPKQ